MWPYYPFVRCLRHRFRLWRHRGRVARLYDRFCASNAGCGGRKHIVGIVLAAGQSTRFCEKNETAASASASMEPKQLALLDDGLPVTQHSIALFAKHVDDLVIVTNTACYSAMCEIMRACTRAPTARARICIAVQDTASRIESIGCGITFARNYLAPDTDTRLLFHDAARPFLTEATVQALLAKAETVPYVQCAMHLTNGLFCNNGGTSVDRDQYVELCTPMCVQYELCEFFYTQFMAGVGAGAGADASEFIDFFSWYQVPTSFLYKRHEELRKITVSEDLSVKK